MNVVLTDAANPTAFGDLIRSGLLWKDSFAPGHGEFAHSYQWLSASTEFLWGGRTGEVYRAVAGVKSTVPFFVKDEGPIKLRPAFLWEWLVDCTEYQDKFDDQAQKAIPAWCMEQLGKWCAKALTNSWFVSAFFRGDDPDIKPVVDLSTFQMLEKRRGEGQTLADEIRKNADGAIKNFFKDFFERFYPVRNALSKTCRNANTVTRIAKSRKSGDTKSDWFISYYEAHRATTLQAREDALAPHMVVQQLWGQLGQAMPFATFNNLIRAELTKAEYQNKTDFGTVKRAAAAALKTSGKKVGTALGGLQAIDVGKASVKGNYDTQGSIAKQWQVGTTDTKRSLYVKPATGDVVKEQKFVNFHGQTGSINIKALG
jgi:hypothetical protein